MCGILGLLGDASKLVDGVAFSRAQALLKTRGPDDSGTWREGELTLEHTRLAIIDLSPTGAQPMQSSDGRWVIVFNGEIYNHMDLRRELGAGTAWRGTSDTETLLEAYIRWGSGCLSKLNGMFAFAIWDRTERRLFLARDRMGVKPLYYCTEPFFAFASRPAALAAVRGQDAIDFDPVALRLYFEVGYIPSPYALLKGIRKLPPAHYVLVDSRGMHICRYWDYRHLKPSAAQELASEADLIEQLDEHLKRSVRMRMLADVPVGAFLSGGVDSAMIAAAMGRDSNVAPTAFTIGFVETTFDESADAAAIAKHLGLRHIVERLCVNQLLELLPAYLQNFDEPTADSTAFSNLAVARLARRHVKVALSGDAGDELFGGYHHYRLLAKLASALTLPKSAKSALKSLLRLSGSLRARQLAGALDANDPVALFAYLRAIGKNHQQLLSPMTNDSQFGAESLFGQWAASFAPNLDLEEIGMRIDLGTLLTDGYLQKLDVATMAYGLEGRCPFTDFELVEWSMRLPLQYKIQNGECKRLLKSVLSRYLPRKLVDKPKRGFVVPSGDWLRGPLRSWATDLIEDSYLTSSLPLDHGYLRQLFHDHCTGKRPAAATLWSVLMLLSYIGRNSPRHGIPNIATRAAA